MKKRAETLKAKLLTLFKNLSLRWKIFFIVLLNVVSLLLFSLIGFTILSKTYNELLYRSIAGNLSFSANTISANLKDVERLSSIILSTPSIQTSLSAIHESDDAVVRSNANRSINTALSSYYETFRQNGVSYIVLYNDAFSNTTNWAAYERTDSAFIHNALENAAAGDGAVSWTTGGGSTSGLFLGRNIRKIEALDFSTIGRLLIYVDTDRLINTINRSFQTFDTGYYILADGPDTIYSSAGLSKDLVTQTLQLEDDTYQTLRVDNHTYFAVSSKIPYYDWRYISLIPFDSIIHSIGRSAKIILGIMVLGILIALALTQWLIYSILRHFNALIVKMDGFSKNELTLEQSAYDYSVRNDEIGRLHQRFDRMATRIRTLVDTNYKNELLRKEAQIKALESQINPHFLYNTLESINWRAKASKNAEISMMAESLGTLLRSTLSNHESLVELDYELELVRAYITIQKIRFEDRLDFVSLVADDLHHILMPPLTIQPLIENAIRYGMEEMTETCHVELLVRHEDDKVLIRVKNNGSVFEEDLLEKLRSREKQPNGFGIGLMNIDQRIRLLFGDACGLELKNEDDCATADIHIQFQVKENQSYAETDHCRR